MSGKTGWAIAAVLLLGGIPLFISNPYFLHVLIMIFLYGAISGAWNIIGGYAGQFSLGHAAFFGIGAYTSTLLFLKFGVTPWLGMVAGGILSAFVSILIFYPCFKLKGIFFALATLAFGEVIMQVSIYWRGLTRGSLGLMIPFRPSFYNLMFEGKLGYYYITLIFLLGIIFISYSIEQSKIGFYLKAIKDDEDAAEAMAIDTAKCKLMALLISSFFTSVGGSIYAQYITLIEPEVAFSLFGISIQIAIMSIIGGIGTFLGPAFGAFVLVPLGEFIRDLLGGKTPGIHAMIYGIMVILIVILLPKGVMRWISDLVQKKPKGAPAKG